MKKKDILFLCQYFYPEYISSATLPFDTAEKLAAGGFSVDALVGYPIEYTKSMTINKDENYMGVNIRRVKYLTLSRKSKLGRLVNYFSFTLSVFFKIGKFKNYSSIIVYSNPPILPITALISKLLFKNKLVFVSYDIYPEIAIKTGLLKENGTIVKFMNKINNFLFKKVDRVVALSNEMKDFILKSRNIQKDKVVVIPNWYQDDRKMIENKIEINNTELKKVYSEEGLYISYFGNMGICQNIDIIIEAAQKFKENARVKFIFAGHGNKVPLLKETILKENLKNVVVFDFLHGNDYKYALQNSDILLVSLVEDISGLAVPSKTYSYMQAGKPIISIMDQDTDIAKDLHAYEAGYNVCDVNELVEKISLFLSDYKLKHQYGENCRKLFEEKYTKEICTDKYIRLFEDLLKTK